MTARFEYELHLDQLQEPLLCTLDYQEPDRSAFPGAQGSSATLVAISLCGKELPLDVVSAASRQAIEADACAWHEGEGVEA